MDAFQPDDIALEIRIVLSKHGQVLFSIPTGANLLTVYGLLEATKDAAREQAQVQMQQAQQAIAIASALPKNGNGNGLRRA